MRDEIKGASIGLLVGVVDCGLFLLSGEPVTIFDVFTAITFWMGMGVVVMTSTIGLPPVTKGIFLSLLLNIPWMIDFTGRGKGEMLIPIIVLAVLFGGLTGFLCKRFAKPVVLTKRSA